MSAEEERAQLLPKSDVTGTARTGKTLTFRESLHEALEEPKSATAKAFFYAVLFAIVVSTASFILQSLHSLENEWYWWPLEVAVVILFTVEILLRFWVWPGTSWSFFTSPLVAIDICALIPFYLEILAHYVKGDLPDLRWMRVLRLVRLFKLGRYSPHLQFMARAIGRSLSGLLLLVFMLIMTLLIFSTMMWMSERGEWEKELNCYARRDKLCSPFQSIAHTMWWAITTMTTVGYGDTTPTDPTGKMIAAVAMLSGIIMLALPTTVLGVQFGAAYTDMKHEDACHQALTESDSDRILELQKLKEQLFHQTDVLVHIVPKVQESVTKELAKQQRDHFFQLGAKGLSREAIAALEELCRTIDDWSPDIKVYRSDIESASPVAASFLSPTSA